MLDTANASSVIDFPEALVRVGIASKTELRFTAPDYFSGVGSPSSDSGFGDAVFGVKQQFGPTPLGFDLWLIVSLSCPSGSKAISSGGYDPELQLPFSRKLNKNWTVAGMFSGYWPTERKRRKFTGQVTWEFDRQLTNSWDAFIEYAWSLAQRGSPANTLHFGTAYKVSADQQIDFHAGFGLSSAAPDRIIGVGYSFRFGIPAR